MLYLNNLSVTDQLRQKTNCAVKLWKFFAFAAFQSEKLAAVGAATATYSSFSTSPHKKSHHSDPYHNFLV